MGYATHRLFIALLLAFPTVAQAAQAAERVQVGQNLVIGEGETVSDAVCVGCSIRVLGRVTGDAVTLGGNIEIEGAVAGDAVGVFGNVDLSGAVGQDLVAVFGNANINGAVGQDVAAMGGNIRLGPEAGVGQDVTTAGGKIERHPQASVGGDVGVSPGLPGLLLLGLLACALSNVLLVLLAYAIAGEGRVQTVAGTVRERTGLALLAGLGVLVAAVALFIISSLLGPVTPIVALIVALGLLVTLVVGYTGLSSWLGGSVARSSGPLVAVLLGALLITILQLLPVLGLFVWLVFIVLALGSAALSGYGTATDWLQQQFAGRPVVPPAAPPAAR